MFRAGNVVETSILTLILTYVFHPYILLILTYVFHPYILYWNSAFMGLILTLMSCFLPLCVMLAHPVTNKLKALPPHLLTYSYLYEFDSRVVPGILTSCTRELGW